MNVISQSELDFGGRETCQPQVSQVWFRLQLKYNSLALELVYEVDRTTCISIQLFI